MDQDLKLAESNIKRLKNMKSLPDETYIFEPVFNNNLIKNLNNYVNLTGPTSMSCIKYFDLRQLVFKFVPKELDSSHIIKIAADLTTKNPIKVETICAENGIHLFKFDCDLGLFFFKFNLYLNEKKI